MNPYLNKKAIVSKRGQWDYPGQDTIVPTPDGSITMQGVNYPVYGQDETGYGQMMYPNQKYQFPGKMVYEKPMMGEGGEMIKRADGSYSQRGLWDNIRANKGSRKKPTEQMLEQEKKIKKQEMGNGGKTNQYFNKFRPGGKPEGDPEDPDFFSPFLSGLASNVQKGLNYGLSQGANALNALGTAGETLKKYQQVPTQQPNTGGYSWGPSMPTQIVETYGSGHSQTLPSTYKPTVGMKKPFQGDLTKITQKLPEGVGGSGWSNFEKAYNAVDKAVGQYLVQPAIELVNTPFATFAEGVNAIQGKEYDFNRALPNPARMAANAQWEGDPNIPNQQFLSDYLGVDREKNPYLAMGLDIFTPGPAMVTKPITALTGIGKAATNTIKYAPKMNALDRAITNPMSFVKEEVSPFVSGINENTGLRFADQTIDAQKAMQQTNQSIVNPVRQPQLAANTTQAVAKEYTPWTMQEMPGLHLQSTMSGGPIEQMAKRSKTGDINVQQALAIIKKESGGAQKEALIRNAFVENIPEKMNYNDFRKVVQDQLIPLERNVVKTYRSKYGIDRIGYNKGDYNAPLENQTILLSNKNKFGKGSSAHENPEETLGHMHFLIDEETPDILTVTQIQSDAFQGTHRTMPKIFDKEQQLKSLVGMEDIAKRQEEMAKTAKQIDSDTWELSDGSRVSKSVLENMGKSQREINALKKAEIENFSQKSLLDKNHQERYLQELVDYAGKRGDVKKVRLPTSETAAKVQNYTPLAGANGVNPLVKKILDESNNIDDFINKLAKEQGINIDKITESDYNTVKSIYDEYKSTNTISKRYRPDEETILKKYDDYGSKDNKKGLIEKLYGKAPNVVTDAKGNTWFEFDIPDSYKQGKAEIKAFSINPVIGGGAATAAGASQLNQKRFGGDTNPYLKARSGIYINPIDPELIKSAQKSKDYLLKMVDSPLFKERYASSTNRNINDISEKEVNDYRNTIIRNINSAQQGDATDLEQDNKNDYYYGWYMPNPTTKQQITKNIKKQQVLDKIGGQEGYNKIKSAENWLYNNSDKIPSIIGNIALPLVGQYTYDLWNTLENENKGHKVYTRNNENLQSTLDHEYSHASTAGEEDLKFYANPFIMNKNLDERYIDYNDQYSYYSKPTEQKARVDAIRSWMMENKMYDPINEKFEKKHLELLKNQNSKFPKTNNLENEPSIYKQIEDIIIPYDDDEIIRMFNTFTKAGKKETNSYMNYARSGIYIKPENRGKFTAWAQNHDMGVQEAASKVMSNKEEYSPSVVKMANFAKNAAGWNKGQDGLEVNLPKASTNMFSDYNPVSDDYTSAMTGMMKARIATDAEFGNAAAKRLTSPFVNPYMFTGNEKIYGEEVGVPAGATGTHFMSSMGQYAVPFIQQKKDGSLYFNENASPSDLESMKFETESDAEYFSNENYKKVAPLMTNWGKYKKGGESDLVPVEVERSERIYDPKGNLLKEIPADAPTHEEGGVKLHLRPGTLVFPKKYYKALDAASGLPEFNKIKEKMLDNAEKAYLRGEPYSSGGRRS